MRFQQFLERKGEKAHRDAVAMGLQYKGFGYWADPNTGEASVCNDDPKLYPLNFMKMEGIKELSELYTIYNIEGNDANSAEIRIEIETLKTTLGEYFKERATGEEINENNELNNEDRTSDGNIRSSIKNNLQKIKNNISKLQGNVQNIKNQKSQNIEKNEEVDEFQATYNEKITSRPNNLNNNLNTNLSKF